METSRRAVAIVLAAALLTGCTYWEPYGRSTESASFWRLPALVRVTTDDTARGLVLAAPFVRADTLFGRSAGDTVGFALSEVRRVERPRVNAVRSVALVLSVTAGWVALGLLGGGLE
jgi:hypothetical protein